MSFSFTGLKIHFKNLKKLVYEFSPERNVVHVLEYIVWILCSEIESHTHMEVIFWAGFAQILLSAHFIPVLKFCCRNQNMKCFLKDIFFWSLNFFKSLVPQNVQCPRANSSTHWFTVTTSMFQRKLLEQGKLLYKLDYFCCRWKMGSYGATRREFLSAHMWKNFKHSGKIYRGEGK